jgi:hypothetical protein
MAGKDYSNDYDVHMIQIHRGPPARYMIVITVFVTHIIQRVDRGQHATSVPTGIPDVQHKSNNQLRSQSSALLPTTSPSASAFAWAWASTGRAGTGFRRILILIGERAQLTRGRRAVIDLTERTSVVEAHAVVATEMAEAEAAETAEAAEDDTVRAVDDEDRDERVETPEARRGACE